jgi:hypothetical protein
MPTPRIAGTVFSQLFTSDIWGSAEVSCADIAENFFYWFKNNGELYKAALPGLTGKITLATIANFGDMRATVAHPTNPSLLIYFNVTDGVNTINTTTGAVVQLLTTAAFNALLSSGGLEMANISTARFRGTKILLHGANDPSGSVWQYDPVAGTAELIWTYTCLGSLCTIGPDATNELMLSGFGAPSNIIYSVNLANSQTRVVAGIGTQDSNTDGNALTTASFFTLTRMFRMADDLFYILDNNFHVVRWIQGGLVGSYAPDAAGARALAAVLPGRNMVVSVGTQDIAVWE